MRSGLRVGVTGSEGLIGRTLCQQLEAEGAAVERLDYRIPEGAPGSGDIRNREDVRALMECDVIVHLAAVSRVAWGERDPALCRSVNVLGTRNLIEEASASSRRPAVLFASSREVYGEPEQLPVSEDAPLRPMNEYGRSKAEGESIVLGGRARGLRTGFLRLANVYGTLDDHPDRVVPAFARAAVHGGPLRVDGTGHTFDFTHVADVARGFLLAIDALLDGNLPPIQLASGRGTTLGELAALAKAVALRPVVVTEAPSRNYDVSKFVGDPRRAESLLGFRCERTLEDGFTSLVQMMSESEASAA